jgi:hypothetical protein
MLIFFLISSFSTSRNNFTSDKTLSEATHKANSNSNFRNRGKINLTFTKKPCYFSFLWKKILSHKSTLDLLFEGEFMSTTSQPKASMRTKLPNGDFLSLTVWAGKTDPTAEVITVQIRHPEGDQWETIGRMAAYRTSDGKYSQLPERPATPKPT